LSDALERLLKRDRAITLGGLALLCALAWVYVVSGAGLGMSAWEMSGFSLFPHRMAAEPAPAMPDMGGMDMSGMDMSGMDGMAMPEGLAPTPSPAAWSAGAWTLIIAMWWVMMVAMMTPSAAPTILLYARVHRHAAAQETAQKLAPTGAFAAGYLLVWLGFSIAAAVLHWTLESAGLVSAMMGSESRWLSGGVLIAAGLYQLSPLKGLCLAHCRAPASFLSQHWRPGAAGAVRLGAMHGAYCVGCCWVLMALLFVGGVMNLVWIAALAVLVLAEKLAPRGDWIGRVVGVVLLAWGAATLVV
jgi:predicted metal-binding membrane protein